MPRPGASLVKRLPPDLLGIEVGTSSILSNARLPTLCPPIAQLALVPNGGVVPSLKGDLAERSRPGPINPA